MVYSGSFWGWWNHGQNEKASKSTESTRGGKDGGGLQTQPRHNDRTKGIKKHQKAPHAPKSTESTRKGSTVKASKSNDETVRKETKKHQIGIFCGWWNHVQNKKVPKRIESTRGGKDVGGLQTQQ